MWETVALKGDVLGTVMGGCLRSKKGGGAPESKKVETTVLTVGGHSTSLR